MLESHLVGVNRWHVRPEELPITTAAAMVVLALAVGAACAEPERGVGVVAVGGEDLSIGVFRFLGIGIDNYQDPDLRLQTAVKGATSLRDLLVKDYTFEEPNCRLLLDVEATVEGIVGGLRSLAESADGKDSVLIYYAGHGHLDRLTNTSSWVPWDATFKTPAKWIDSDRIRKLLKASRARHTLLVSDSCFAGDFFRGNRDIVVPEITDSNIRRSFTLVSRKAMTSGGVEPVADGGQDRQSIYT